MITRALNEDEHVLVASIDLSSAFDVVDSSLSPKRLSVAGLPVDLIALIEVWLKNLLFYVQANGQTSNFYKSQSGTIQGSILGPILYAINVAPLFDITDLYNFARDNFSLTQNKNKEHTKEALMAKLHLTTKWLKESGLKVNKSKTKICAYHRNDTPL